MKTYRSLIATFVLSTLHLAYGEEIRRELGTDTYDTWFSSYYHKYQGVNNHLLQTGGWGDSYRFLIRFNLRDLPKKATKVGLYFYCFDSGGSSSNVGMNLWRVTSYWNESTGWDNMPDKTVIGSLPAPTKNSWYGIDITEYYNKWQSGAYTNYGFLFSPRGTNNQFNSFYSTDYSKSSYRPFLRVEYGNPLDLKLPLPANKSWLLTTEVGGLDCATLITAQSHEDINYYSLNFSAQTLENNKNPESNVPILAAGKGMVVEANYNNKNGHYVVIDHDGDGNLATGFSTRYLHMKHPPLVKKGEQVVQGKILGIMGDTGVSDGVHLHFGVRFENEGFHYIPQLDTTKMEGRLLKQYLTDCNGTTRTAKSYYRSTNTPK